MRRTSDKRQSSAPDPSAAWGRPPRRGPRRQRRREAPAPLPDFRVREAIPAEKRDLVLSAAASTSSRTRARRAGIASGGFSALLWNSARGAGRGQRARSPPPLVDQRDERRRVQQRAARARAKAQLAAESRPGPLGLHRSARLAHALRASRILRRAARSRSTAKTVPRPCRRGVRRLEARGARIHHVAAPVRR